MGLDSIWINPETDRSMALAFDPPLRLCGGIATPDDSSNFRGKVYDPFIHAVTGVSLYQQMIPNEIVKQMAAALETVAEPDIEVPNKEVILKYGEIEFFRTTHPSVEELRDLKRMFRAYADAGACLIAFA